MYQLTKEELDLLTILSDPALWAKVELDWDARWYQKEILSSKSRKIVVRAGRRTGKTDALCIFALYHAYIQLNRGKDPGYRVLYIAPYESQVNEFFSRIRELMSNSENLLASVVRDVRNPHEIELANGSIIRGMSAGSKTGKAAANVRGQKADLLVLDEASYLLDKDVNTLLAIQLQDPQRIKIIAASTPSGREDHFKRWCLNKDLGWHEFHYPSWVNPNWNPEMEAELREELPGEAYTLEVAAEFGSEDKGVFLRQYVELAIKRGRDIGLKYSDAPPERKGPRVLGCDWDKFSSGTNIAIVEYDQTLGLYKPIYRVEIPRSQFTLDNAVSRIILLNELYDLDYIYVDRGYGEMQVETLHKYGLQNPHTRLHEKVKGVTFGDTIKVPDPFTRELVKKPLKHWIIGNLQVLFERGRIVMPPDDRVMARQFYNYRVKGYTSQGQPTYSDEDEHIIDAVGLAVHGLLTHFSDICRVKVGHGIVSVSNIIAKADKEVFKPKRKPKMSMVGSRSMNTFRRSFSRSMSRSIF